MGAILDPFGFKWSIATHFKDVSFEETEKEFKKMMEKNHMKGGVIHPNHRSSCSKIYKEKYSNDKQKYLNLKN